MSILAALAVVSCSYWSKSPISPEGSHPLRYREDHSGGIVFDVDFDHSSSSYIAFGMGTIFSGRGPAALTGSKNLIVHIRPGAGRFDSCPDTVSSITSLRISKPVSGTPRSRKAPNSVKRKSHISSGVLCLLITLSLRKSMRGCR